MIRTIIEFNEKTGKVERHEEHSCDSCELIRINGVVCHETGCPDAWQDSTRECFDCGIEFIPAELYQRLCDDCQAVADFESLSWR